MAFHVRDNTTDLLVRRLAGQRGVGLTEAVKIAVRAELGRHDDWAKAQDAKARAVLAEIDSWKRTGAKADKAFFDELSGD